jgi:hypothetical protein
MIRSQLSGLLKQVIGLVLRLTSLKQRSMMFWQCEACAARLADKPGRLPPCLR